MTRLKRKNNTVISNKNKYKNPRHIDIAGCSLQEIYRKNKIYKKEYADPKKQMNAPLHTLFFRVQAIFDYSFKQIIFYVKPDIPVVGGKVVVFPFTLARGLHSPITTFFRNLFFCFVITLNFDTTKLQMHDKFIKKMIRTAGFSKPTYFFEVTGS